jgi:hypothetical protein
MTDRTDFCAELIKGYLDEIELLERELAEAGDEVERLQGVLWQVEMVNLADHRLEKKETNDE